MEEDDNEDDDESEVTCLKTNPIVMTVIVDCDITV